MRTLSLLRLALTGAFVTLALVASGCGTTTSSSGTPTDTTAGEDASADTATDTGTGSDSSSDIAAVIPFSTVYPKMAATCAASGCHTTADAKFSGKLDLSAKDLAYAGLTSGTPTDALCGTNAIVKKGDHANSSLWIRLNADKAVTCAGVPADGTGKMPSGGTAYTADELKAVADWIDGGAAQ
jgi:hypothetical protein